MGGCATDVDTQRPPKKQRLPGSVTQNAFGNNRDRVRTTTSAAAGAIPSARSRRSTTSRCFWRGPFVLHKPQARALLFRAGVPASWFNPLVCSKPHRSSIGVREFLTGRKVRSWSSEQRRVRSHGDASRTLLTGSLPINHLRKP